MTPPTEAAPLTAESQALLTRLRNVDDLYPCSECTSPDGPCVDEQRVLHVVSDALLAIEAAARQPLLDEVARLREALGWTLANLGGWSHPIECLPSECRCGYAEARAALRDGGER